MTADLENMELLAYTRPPLVGSGLRTQRVGGQHSCTCKRDDPKIVDGRIHLDADRKIGNLSITTLFDKNRMDEYGFYEVVTQNQLQ